MSIFSALIGTSTVIRHVQHLVVKVAEGNGQASVLITGEPGTGKEMIAKAIHEKSSRASFPFVPIKCAGIPDDAMETEIFGNAASGDLKPGRVGLAEGGVLYLEDIEKLSHRMQSLLVKALQENQFTPVGSQTPIAFDVRIICSTALNLEQTCREKQFREDLYYRLANCAIYVPPLRERREDIATLIEHFIQKYNTSKSKTVFGISSDSMGALLQHSWPHNIVDLENLIERIVVLKGSGSIEVCDLPPRLRQLVTDNIDSFYEKAPVPQQQNKGVVTNRGSLFRPDTPTMQTKTSFQRPGYSSTQLGSGTQFNPSILSANYDECTEIDQFVKKDIDLAGGIDFYRVVEEFENKLIAEALRRTNHNKNRAAQLLSMNRTTLVEKLKKRAASSSVKSDGGRVKKNPAFTIFDGLGNDDADFDNLDQFSRNSFENLSDAE